MKIASPPRRGIIFWCTLRAFGLSVAPILNANLITKGVTTNTVMKDAKTA
ncbi:Teichoic acid linkage unit synthesis [Bacillus pseudomycoides DSM 12442]|nr:Teichoic acid linkage unit synthesis [Bacillus pseudomycoides DSM 12442]